MAIMPVSAIMAVMVVMAIILIKAILGIMDVMIIWPLRPLCTFSPHVRNEISFLETNRKQRIETVICKYC
jgi:hypothetical protein